MMPAFDTRKAILKRAERYLQDAGFASFSFRDLANDLGIKSASVHYHFRSKEELGIALLQRYQEQFNRWTESRKTAGSPKGDLLQWFEYEQHLCRAGDICPGGAFGAEFAVLPERVREELEKLHGMQRQWMRMTIATGRQLGEIRPEGKVEDQAEMVLAALQGGLKIARASRDPKAFDGMLEQLKVMLFT
jgi:TetR/AcrR family transcriptional regulator, transcriptional repressor for nem operon